MFKSPMLFAGALGACLLSATGVTLAAAHAEIFEADAAVTAQPTTSSILQAATPQPAGDPAEAQQPAPAAEPAAAPAPSPAAAPVRAEPVRRAAAATGAADAELTCLARVILYEAGAESRAGQVAVAQVVLNRARSGRFPRTICGVINQRGQFSAIRSFHPRRDARWNRALGVARAARSGERVAAIGNALFFHAARVRPFSGRTRVARLGGHIFYR
ncbi:MAG TPA: cell wall hydrolase [Allosphingosinicella sp.]|jgi:spore germination cell wall hydrolase CwlJ-like protein